MSHLFPTSSTWALSHEYVLIWVDLGTNTPISQTGSCNAAFRSDRFYSVCEVKSCRRTTYKIDHIVMNYETGYRGIRKPNYIIMGTPT